jgi:hypothetical protein
MVKKLQGHGGQQEQAKLEPKLHDLCLLLSPSYQAIS